MASNSRKTAKAELGAKWLRFIDRGIQSGRYRSRRDAIESALKLLEERELELGMLMDMTRRKIDQGVAEAERGELIDASVAFEHVRSRSQTPRRRKTA